MSLSDGDRHVEGTLFDLQRALVHEGPGVRAGVFLKGCPLHCLWCQNPEGIAPQPVILFAADRCTGCGACLAVCDQQAQVLADGLRGLDRGRCRVCARCVSECPAGALELAGNTRTAGDVLGEVLSDRAVYERSGGGLTVSGGEPLLQVDFVEALLRLAQGHSLHTAVATCGAAEWSRFERLLPVTDLFLFDYKETDPVLHKDFTGVDNRQILANLRRLHATGKSIYLRCPIIPDYNDCEDHFEGIVALWKSLPGLAGIELAPYQRLGDAKLDRLGWPQNHRFHAEPPEPEAIESWAQFLRERDVPV